MITINEVQQVIEKLEAAGELSMKEEKYLELAKAYVQLAAENVGLKDCVANNAPAVDHWNAWADPEDKIKHAPETPATDRIVAGIKADGVEEFAKALDGAADVFGKSKALEAQENFLYFSGRGFAFAKQLREGADK